MANSSVVIKPPTHQQRLVNQPGLYQIITGSKGLLATRVEFSNAAEVNQVEEFWFLNTFVCVTEISMIITTTTTTKNWLTTNNFWTKKKVLMRNCSSFLTAWKNLKLQSDCNASLRKTIPMKEHPLNIHPCQLSIKWWLPQELHEMRVVKTAVSKKKKLVCMLTWTISVTFQLEFLFAFLIYYCGLALCQYCLEETKLLTFM